MTHPDRSPQNPTGNSSSPNRLARGWMATADWLGGCRPVELIAGAVAIIAVFTMIGHLAA